MNLEKSRNYWRIRKIGTNWDWARTKKKRKRKRTRWNHDRCEGPNSGHNFLQLVASSKSLVGSLDSKLLKAAQAIMIELIAGSVVKWLQPFRGLQQVFSSTLANEINPSNHGEYHNFDNLNPPCPETYWSVYIIIPKKVFSLQWLTALKYTSKSLLYWWDSCSARLVYSQTLII